MRLQELIDLTPPKIMAAKDDSSNEHNITTSETASSTDDVDSAPVKAKNGKKKGSGGLGDFFVPVNEHKKGLR